MGFAPFECNLCVKVHIKLRIGAFNRLTKDYTIKLHYSHLNDFIILYAWQWAERIGASTKLPSLQPLLPALTLQMHSLCANVQKAHAFITVGCIYGLQNWAFSWRRFCPQVQVSGEKRGALWWDSDMQMQKDLSCLLHLLARASLSFQLEQFNISLALRTVHLTQLTCIMQNLLISCRKAV